MLGRKSERLAEAESMAIVWQGFDWGVIFQFFVAWELVYQLGKLVCSWSRHEKIRLYGASYWTAYCNAAICFVGSAYFLPQLLNAPAESVVASFPSNPFFDATDGIRLLAQPFLAWLLYDLLHIILWFPELGGVDQLVHHSGFLCFTTAAIGYRLFPFTAAWLLLGEGSSIFLNIRWFLIATGRGDTVALNVAQYGFAISFFLLRVVVFWLGVYRLLSSTRPLCLAPPYSGPTLVVNTLCGMVCGGMLLNTYWMVMIYKMATRGGAKPKKDKAA